MALVEENTILNQNQEISGYASDDELSDVDEPMDAGKTRSSTRKTNQPSSNQDSNTANDTTTHSTGETNVTSEGRKRKRNLNAAGDGSGSDEENSGGDKNRLKLEEHPKQSEVKVVCSCPKNVMRCIGILPSMPIVTYFNDNNSDDTDSSLDDLSHVVLPSVSRQEKESC